MKPLVVISFLSMIAAARPSSAGDIFPFEPVQLSARETNSIESAARPHGGGAEVRSIQAGALLGELAVAIVEFEPYEVRPDYSLRLGISCTYASAAWTCKGPYRIVTLLNEAPLVEIELRGDVTVKEARRILKFVRRREASRFVALTGIERTSHEEYWVETTYPDGGGTSSVSSQDLAKIND